MEILINTIRQLGLVTSLVIGALFLVLIILTIHGFIKKQAADTPPQHPALRIVGNVVLAFFGTIAMITILGLIGEGLAFMAFFVSPIIFGIILFLIFKSQNNRPGL